MAGLLADKQEKAKSLAAARAAYEKVMQQFAKHELYPTAVLERAKVIAATDVERRRSTSCAASRTTATSRPPPVAPMALLQLATYLRAQNKAQEAADVLAKCRQENEEKLKNDPARAAWVPLLQYHHGLALKEAGKRAEARTVLEGVIKGSPNRPEAAEAALRWGQSLKDDGLSKIAEARKKLANPEPQAGGEGRREQGARGRAEGRARRGGVPRNPGRRAEEPTAAGRGPRRHAVRGRLGQPHPGRRRGGRGPGEVAAGALGEAQGRGGEEDAAGRTPPTVPHARGAAGRRAACSRPSRRPAPTTGR